MHYTLCDQFSDLTQNSIEALASKVEISLIQNDKELTLTLKDNGKGMDEEQLKKAQDPFYTDGVKHPNRKVGLGIPFLIQTATETGGKWKITSEKGKGTEVDCCFDLSNIDTPPVGDVPGYFRDALTLEGSYEMIIHRENHSNKMTIDYTVTRSELIEALGDMSNGGALVLLGQYLKSLETEEN